MEGHVSEDGVTWTRLSDSSNGTISARSYENGTIPNRKFVAIGAHRSPDTYKDYVTINLEQSFIDTWNPPYDSNINSSPGSTRTKLTFADPNPDLQYFLPGDVVQGPNWNQSQVWSANVFNGAKAVNAYDGDLETSDYGSTYTNTFTTPITVSSLRVYADGNENSVQVYLDGMAVNVPWTGAVAKQWHNVPISGDSQVFSRITISNGSTALYAVEADGKVLVDNGIAATGETKVISVDPDSNTMVVDGGEWSAPVWDQSAEWVALSTFTNLSDPGSLTGLGLYDGVAEGDPGQTAENYIRLTASGTAVLTHTFTNVTEFAISASSSKTECTIQFDDGAEQTFVPAADTGFPRIEIVNPPSSWNKLTINSKNSTTYVSKIWVNNLALVDPSIKPPLNDDQTWSNAPSANYGNIQEVFDGELTTGAQVPTNTLGTIDASAWGFSDCLVEVYAAQQSPNITIQINGTPCPATASGGNKEWTGVDVTGPLTSITCINTLGAHTLRAVRIDGVLLVDPSKDDHVEYQTNGGQGDIIEVNTTDNTLVIKDTGDRDNRWIKGFSVAGPSIIDTPLLTNDVQLRGSDFATTPADADTLKEIVWSINDVEYSAGVTNPWSPLEKLPTNTTVTVKVKYKGNVLEDSDWSPDVTFTTGASMRSLFTRIAALEANDVTDDATDTALLTLIAGLAARIQALEESN